MEKVFEKIKDSNTKRIAIMGGTFDPIHFGHLAAAENVRKLYGFDSIIFMPSGDPPHKIGISVSSAEDRYVMVQMATASNPYFKASRMEIDRVGKTYTVDTIKELRIFLGDKAEIFFITGSDALLEIMTWKNPTELLSLCSLIAVARPGYKIEALKNKISELKKNYQSDIRIAKVASINISSTVIRNRVRSNLPIKYMVPECVESYIYKNNLYIDDKL